MKTPNKRALITGITGQCMVYLSYICKNLFYQIKSVSNAVRILLGKAVNKYQISKLKNIVLRRVISKTIQGKIIGTGRAESREGQMDIYGIAKQINSFTGLSWKNTWVENLKSMNKSIMLMESKMTIESKILF